MTRTSHCAAFAAGVKSVAPPALPRIVWETGASTYNLTETQQAQWATLMLEAVTSLGVHGFNWWQFIDWAPIPSRPCRADTQCQKLHFGTHNVDGSPKKVWAALKSPDTVAAQAPVAAATKKPVAAVTKAPTAAATTKAPVAAATKKPVGGSSRPVSS